MEPIRPSCRFVRLPRVFTLAVALLFLLPACGYLSRWPAPERAQADLSRLLSERTDEKTFWADGWIRAEREGRGISFPAEIFIEFPRRARITVFGLFDRPQAYLTSDGETLSLYLPEESRFHQGKAQGPHLSALLGLPPLEIEEILLLLSGRAPLEGPAAQGARLSQDRWLGWWKASLDAPPRSVSFPMSGRRITAFEQGTGESLLLASFSNFRGPTCESAEFPRKIELRAPGRKALLRATWSEVEIDTPADVPFTLDPPPGLPILPLSSASLAWER